MLRSRKSQGGFSLVELMVVVAIIGVLASIAVPSINKYLAKARQTEAKTNLSSLYTSEKAFYAEYTAYHSSFAAIGFSPEGKLRYNVGFGNAGTVAGPMHGFTTVIAAADLARISTRTACVADGGAMTATQTCAMLRGATGAVAPNLAATHTVATGAGAATFLGGATAVIHSSGTADLWEMDQNKVLTNRTNGIP